MPRRARGQPLVDFRRKYPKHADADRFLVEHIESLRSAYGTTGGISRRRSGPILVCEEGARLRGLDLEIASADARHWWATGKVPLRPTPVVASDPATASKASPLVSVMLFRTADQRRDHTEQKAKRWWQLWK